MNKPTLEPKYVLHPQSLSLTTRNMEEAMNSEDVFSAAPKLKSKKEKAPALENIEPEPAAEPEPEPEPEPVAVEEESSTASMDLMEQQGNSNGCSTYGKWMIAVVSSPNHFSARKAIRVTWGSRAKGHGIPVKFFVGKYDPTKPDAGEIKAKLEKEQTENNDMIRPDSFTESYHNLTAKAISIFQ